MTSQKRPTRNKNPSFKDFNPDEYARLKTKKLSRSRDRIELRKTVSNLPLNKGVDFSKSSTFNEGGVYSCRDY